jgi:hypothetical protein
MSFFFGEQARIPEPCRRQFSVAHCVLNIAVPIRLQGSRVVSLIGQCVATGMPEHVRMGLEPKPRLSSCAFDHAGEASGREWRSTF